jgi:hypothetical protein
MRAYLNLKIALAAFKHQLTPALDELKYSDHSQIPLSPSLQLSGTPVLKTKADTIVAFQDTSLTFAEGQQSTFTSSNQPQKPR